ncbi:X2-like carbohydrate binding domain-containing protein [Paenibacillus sp. HJGM_3]|uniref:X2-like carbohydrate binding domain-containing protein n=1 Tax=Paenibacillus sp. HJGM_3 TaxID=3379816 RepID=UPI0038581EF3
MKQWTLKRKSLTSILHTIMVLGLFITSFFLAPQSTSADTRLTAIATSGLTPEAVAVNPVTNKIYVANYGSTFVTVIDGASNTTTTVLAGTNPTAIAVNPVTNKIYVANTGSASVTVIEGVSNTPTAVPVGTSPSAIAVNPVTNTIYVANTGSASVTVIDGASNTPTTVPVGTSPSAIAVNPVTNKIYVANASSNNVTVIDGASNTTTPVAAETNPRAIVVNPVTNKIYVTNYGSANVTVIDGASNTMTPIAAETNPRAIVVNPVTNKIYVANEGSTSVTVIDGASNTTTRVVAGSSPWEITVNPVTNKIYVTNAGSNNVTVIDGASNTPTAVPAETTPKAIAVNPVTNKIFVANSGSDNVTVIDGASNTPTTVAAGSNPFAVAVNPVTNKTYIANRFNDNVTVIEGANNTTTTVPVGHAPCAIAVNPVTNKIYVSNCNDQDVTVIDGATNTTTTVPVGSNPLAVAVNPVTDKIYVAHVGIGKVTVIDGVSNTKTLVTVGTSPRAIGLNPVTNKIYVANADSNNVTVIDGASNTTTTIAAGTSPWAIAVNPVTNKIYVANNDSSNVTVIDGASNTTTTPVAVGLYPSVIAVNPVTNKIYVNNPLDGKVTIIDGTSNTTTTAPVGTSPSGIAVNPVTNKIYVANENSDTVTVIDGATNTTTHVAAGADPYTLAVNSVTNKIYVLPNNSSVNVTVIDAAGRTMNPMNVAIMPLPDNIAHRTSETFTFQVTNSYTPFPSVVQSVYFQLDSTEGPWIQANRAGSDWTGTTTSMTRGEHTIYALVLEAQGGGVPAGVAAAYRYFFIPDSGIDQTSASFDKKTSAQADIPVTMTLNGNTLSAIKNGASALASGTDYTVAGNIVTINKNYLATQAVGTTNLTFDFEAGVDPVLAVTVIDTTIYDSTITPTTAAFDKKTSAQADIPVTMTLNGNTLSAIKNGTSTLVSGTDYIVSGSTVTIKKSYLAAQTVGTTNLTFDFSAGVDPILAVTVSDTTPTPPSPSDEGDSTPPVTLPLIDLNGVTLNPDTIDTTKPSVTLEVTPKDGVAYVSIPASILTSFEGKNPTFLIEIKTPYGIYRIPVNVASLIPGLKDLLANHNLKAEDIHFKIVLTDKSGDKDIRTALSNDLPEGKVLGAMVDFHIDVINTKTGQTIGTADQFNKALTRVIPMPKSIASMPEQWGAFRYNDTTKKFQFVPAKKVLIDGIWYVMIRSYSNSVYTVAENAASFTDVLKHWSQSFVELAAAKGLVDGVGGGLYNPDRAVTRAEFTAMLVRALGRGTSTGSTVPYDDVKQNAWYFGEVAKAKELGLLNFVKGYSFMPDQPLTREDMASMLAAVITLENLAITQQPVSLDGYKDIGSVDASYLEDVRLMVKLQIMTGTAEDTFSPKGETTRAQAVVVFVRTLKTLGSID